MPSPWSPVPPSPLAPPPAAVSPTPYEHPSPSCGKPEGRGVHGKSNLAKLAYIHGHSSCHKCTYRDLHECPGVSHCHCCEVGYWTSGCGYLHLTTPLWEEPSERKTVQLVGGPGLHNFYKVAMVASKEDSLTLVTYTEMYMYLYMQCFMHPC